MVGRLEILEEEGTISLHIITLSFSHAPSLPTACLPTLCSHLPSSSQASLPPIMPDQTAFPACLQPFKSGEPLSVSPPHTPHHIRFHKNSLCFLLLLFFFSYSQWTRTSADCILVPLLPVPLCWMVQTMPAQPALLFCISPPSCLNQIQDLVANRHLHF